MFAMYVSHERWWPNVHLINICHYEISQLAESESLLWEANLAWGRKSSQLHAEDRMSFLIMEMDREKISNFYGQRKDVCDCESVHHAISASLLTRRTPCRDVKWNKICNCRVFFGVIYSLLCVFICSCCKNINMIHLKHKTLQLNIFIFFDANAKVNTQTLERKQR